MVSAIRLRASRTSVSSIGRTASSVLGIDQFHRGWGLGVGGWGLDIRRFIQTSQTNPQYPILSIQTFPNQAQLQLPSLTLTPNSQPVLSLLDFAPPLEPCRPFLHHSKR